MDRLAVADARLFEGFRLDYGGLSRLDQAGVADAGRARFARPRPAALAGRTARRTGIQGCDHGGRLARHGGRGKQSDGSDLGIAAHPRSASRARQLYPDDSRTRLPLCRVGDAGRSRRFRHPRVLHCRRRESRAMRSASFRQYERRGPGAASISPTAWSRRSSRHSSRIRWLFVIARNSSFTYKGQAIDVKQVGRDLGVRYVLEGSVRKADSRVRITAQLIDALERRAPLSRPLRWLA